MKYIDENSVLGVRESQAPMSRSRTGYGGKQPTSYELLIGKQWRRVYVMIYSNSGTAYVLIGGKKVLLGGFDPRDWMREHPNYRAPARRPARPRRRW